MKAGKKQIAHLFIELGIMLEILGENPFKSRAYKNAARTIERLPDDLEEMTCSGELIKVEGIGPAITKKIATIIETGSLPKLDEVKAIIPPGLFPMLQIPELTPRKINLLWKKLGITTVAELERACREYRLAELRGFSEESQERILGHIRRED
jgi:DNA polymerase (family X)